MTANPGPVGPDGLTNGLSDADTEALLLQLRRKQGTWVAWGQACQALQRSGHTAQSIFEATGFEPIQQNQVIVAAQVYGTLEAEHVPDAVLEHFQQRGSDVLYELRILNQTERQAAATLALEQKLDLDEAREVAKAVKDLARLGKVPDGFSTHPGDAMAYQVWKQTRQKSDFQERARLIAKGLRFAQSPSARKQIEQLLTDMSVTPQAKAPELPFYRLSEEEELPRVLPMVGHWPIAAAAFAEVPAVAVEGAFQVLASVGSSVVTVPGWQVVRAAIDPVALVGPSDCFPTPPPGKVEDVLILVDRGLREWRGDRYFAIEEADQIAIQWFDEAPNIPLLGQVILILRAKKVVAQDYTNTLLSHDQRNLLERWQLEE
jgi:hypothetical protein